MKRGDLVKWWDFQIKNFQIGIILDENTLGKIDVNTGGAHHAYNLQVLTPEGITRLYNCRLEMIHETR